jgi:hypothetical protein
MKDSVGWPGDEEVEQTLALHVLSPLIDGYEKTVVAMQRQIDQTSFKFKQQMQDLEEVLLENNSLREQLEVSKRQFLAIVDRNKDNLDFIEGNDKRQGPAKMK